MSTSNVADMGVGIYWSWFIRLNFLLNCIFKKNLTGEHRWEGMRWDCVFWQVHTHNMNRSSLCQKGRQKKRGGNTSISQMLMKKHLCRMTDEESYVWELTDWCQSSTDTSWCVDWSKEWKEMQLQLHIIVTQSHSCLLTLLHCISSAAFQNLHWPAFKVESDMRQWPNLIVAPPCCPIPLPRCPEISCCFVLLSAPSTFQPCCSVPSLVSAVALIAVFCDSAH